MLSCEEGLEREAERMNQYGLGEMPGRLSQGLGYSSPPLTFDLGPWKGGQEGPTSLGKLQRAEPSTPRLGRCPDQCTRVAGQVRVSRVTCSLHPRGGCGVASLSGDKHSTYVQVVSA